jgi:AcrR family transcriptional regulator
MTSTGDPSAGQAGAGKTPGAPVSVWDLPERGTRGPRARHDRAAITAIAVRIADAEGLEAVTMRRVAGELGIAVMTLYNYVPAKDHLAQLMADRLAGEYAYPVTPAADPRAAITDLAGQAREIARRHPWVGGLMQRPLPPGPNGLRYLDYFLGLLAGSSLDTGAKMEVIALISGFATMYGVMQAALPAEGKGATQQNAAQVQAFARAVASGRYPNLAAALAAGGPPRSHDDIFGSCIERLIDLAGPGLLPPAPDLQRLSGRTTTFRKWASRINIPY